MAKNEEEVSWQIWHGSGTKCPEGTIPVRRVVPHKNGTTDSEAGVEVTLGHEVSIQNPFFVFIKYLNYVNRIESI